MDRQHLSLEQNVRLDEVIGRFQPRDRRRGHIGSLKIRVSCWIACTAKMPSPENLALKRLREVTKKPIDFDLNAPDDARVSAVNAAPREEAAAQREIR